MAIVTVNPERGGGVDRSAFTLIGGSAVPAQKVGTGLVALGQIVIPEGSMGPNGVLRFSFKWSHNNAAASKTIGVKFGNLGTVSDPWVYQGATTSGVAGHMTGEIANRNNNASQIGNFNNALTLGSSTVPLYTGTVDTSLESYLLFCISNAGAGDTFTLESFFAELLARP